ncbi:TPA: phosphoribosylformylglycinamidine cyclo-ligase [Candidatus Taylorbacteria bacterium]|nr:phosphoribosylformylglycinamidine cyclo-ligase [Candidatus Taylorbacteria bacterium]
MAKKAKEGITYAGSGVNYDDMDPFKRACQKRAALTSQNAKRLGVEPLEWTRGESVYVVKIGNRYHGHVEEGLGTKNIVADLLRRQLAILKAIKLAKCKSFYNQIAQCTVAMIVNDMVTLGIFPTTVDMHLAVGDSKWFRDQQRVDDLIEGFGDACDKARCIWGGGETPTLKGIVMQRSALLSGSAAGVSSRYLINPDFIGVGDVIVLVESNGLMANGFTLARAIAKKLPKGYLTKLPDGTSFGEALLAPTPIFVDLVEDCLDGGVDIHYCVNITGHGWRKLMRAKQSFTYVIKKLPTPRPIFDFIMKHGPVDVEEAYGNLNMGAGFALYVPRRDVNKVIAIAKKLGKRAFDAGFIKEGPKRVEIEPVTTDMMPRGLWFGSGSLAVR